MHILITFFYKKTRFLCPSASHYFPRLFFKETPRCLGLARAAATDLAVPGQALAQGTDGWEGCGPHSTWLGTCNLNC